MRKGESLMSNEKMTETKESFQAKIGEYNSYKALLWISILVFFIDPLLAPKNYEPFGRPIGSPIWGILVFIIRYILIVQEKKATAVFKMLNSKYGEIKDSEKPFDKAVQLCEQINLTTLWGRKGVILNFLQEQKINH